MWTWPVDTVSDRIVKNGSPVSLGLKGSCRSSCAAPLFLAGEKTEVWRSSLLGVLQETQVQDPMPLLPCVAFSQLLHLAGLVPHRVRNE